MMYLVLLATLAVGFYAATGMSGQISKNERCLAQLRLANDSGIEFVRYQLGNIILPYGTNSTNLLSNTATALGNALNGTSNMGGSTIAITNGTIYIPSATTWITVDPTAQTKFRAAITQSGNNLIVTVHSSGPTKASIKGIQMQFQTTPFSMVGLSSITLRGAAYTDSYDSTKGAYVQANAHQNGSIASNGNILLTNTVKVNGAARPGPGMTTTLQNAATVSGLSAPLPGSVSYPAVTLPAVYTDLGDVNMSSGTTSLAGGTYLIHNLTLSGTAIVNWTGPVNLYIQNSYSVSQSAQINTYQNLPANRTLHFLPTCTTATWSGSNICVGELYAPNTDFTISGSVELFGRITAHSINNTSTGGMHSDESMAPCGAGGFMVVPGSYLEVP